MGGTDATDTTGCAYEYESAFTESASWTVPLKNVAQVKNARANIYLACSPNTDSSLNLVNFLIDFAIYLFC